MNDWYYEFWKKNRKLILTHLTITILILPLEILILTVYTKKLFKSLQDNDFPVFVRLFIGFIIFLAALQLMYVWREYLDNQITPRVQSFIRNKCLVKYIRQPRDSYNAGSVMGTISHLPKNFYQNYASIFKFWVPFYTVFFVFTLYLFWLDLSVGMYSLVTFAVFLVSFTLLYRKLASCDYRESLVQGELLFHYENILMNSETIQAYNKQDEEIKNLEKLERKFEKSRITLITLVDVTKVSFVCLVFIFLLAVFQYLYAKLMRSPKEFPPWKFISFITILFFVVRTIISLMNQFRHIVSLGGKLYNTSNLGSSLETDHMEQKFQNYDIEIKNLKFSYPSNPNVFILEDFNLKIPEKGNLLIKGKIGSGKSTVAKLLSKVYIPNDGEISIGGINIHMIPMSQYKNIVFMMSQHTILFSGKTVFENIVYAVPKGISKQYILENFNLPKTFESNLDKKVLEHGINLSGGQRRMIYILRALLHPAPIVILDEPTDSLDIDSSSYIYGAIQRLQRKKTVICISHDESLENIFSEKIHFK